MAPESEPTLPDRESKDVQRAIAVEAVIDAAPRVTMVIDAAGTIRWISAAALHLVGRPADELVGRSILEFVAPEDVGLVTETIDYVLSTTGQYRPMEFRFRRSDGTTGVVEVVSANRLEDPRIQGIVVQVHDVTERRITDEVLELIAAGGGFDTTLRLLAHLLEVQLGDTRGMVGIDPHGGRFRTAASANDIVDELTDVALSDEPGAVSNMAPGEDAALRTSTARGRVESGTASAATPAHAAGDEPDTPWAEAIRTGRPVIHSDLAGLDPAVRDEARSQGFAACWVFPVVLPATGQVSACLIAWRTRPGRPSPGEQVAIDRMSRLLSLALERRHTQDLLVHAARHDPLTGLPNRAQFFKHLVRELHRPGHLVAVLYLDLDGFKPINDRYGHRAGDNVLAQIARRIEAALRPRDLTARLGGDEFGVLCSQLRDEAEAVVIAERLIAAVEQPLIVPAESIRPADLAQMAGAPVIDITDRVQPVVVTVSVSVGIAFGHQSGSDDERLVELADAAMYQAKATGRGSWFRSVDRAGDRLGAGLEPT